MIESSKKIILTDSAKMRLEKLHSEVDNQITDYLRDRKNVPGDDFIEVTASDIDDLSTRLKIIRPASRVNTKELVVFVYGVCGAVLTVVGLFFNQLKAILFEDKERALLIAMGLILLFSTTLFSYINRLKYRRERELIDYERTKQKEADFYSKYKEK